MMTCAGLMTTTRCRPVVAVTYRATVDVLARFRKSKAVGVVFGLTSSKYQSALRSISPSAWRLLMFQKNNASARWFRTRTENARSTRNALERSF